MVTYWACRNCSQTRNTQDITSCKTCHRPRGFHPDRNRNRSFEHRHNYDYDDYDNSSEEFTCANSWGLILGLILLVVVVSVLSWAFYMDYMDHREAMRESAEL
mmetsp:Transcript_57869/g.154241  ORF Transcript_57869/g.154241 Transcript_57869/m.154241 type:complete len:103 (-) Transcript_57869:120-428(-)